MSRLLSVIIPSYQHARFIAQCIDAAAAIPIADKELIVVDDGSNDGSVDVISERIAALAPEVPIVMRHRENRGLVRTLNEGLSLATGTYICVVASDDVLLGDGVGRLVAAMQADHRLQFVIGNGKYLGDRGAPSAHIYDDRQAEFVRGSGDTRIRALFLHYPNFLVQSCVLRGAALRAIGGWDEALTLDDYPLFLRLFQRWPVEGEHFAYRPDIISVAYRLHGTNSFRNARRQASIVAEVLEKYCPRSLLRRALAMRFARYAFGALRAGAWSVAVDIAIDSLRRAGLLASVGAPIELGVRLFRARRRGLLGGNGSA